jgi:flavin-dependent dehydrogenase
MILDLVDEQVQVTDQARCMGCFGCEDECPNGAVRVLRARPGDAPIPVEPPPGDVARCDVAVVGAGPAGLGAAIASARAGLDVVLFERLPNRTLSHHVDGGVLFSLPWMTSIEVDRRADRQAVSFPELDISLETDSVYPCGTLGLLGPGGLRTGSEFPAGLIGWAWQKDRFVEALVAEAERAGAQVWFNAKVDDLLRDGDRIAGVKLAGGQEIRARVVVAADGVWAQISEKAGLSISHDDLWYFNILAFEYDNVADLPAGLYYLNGELMLDEGLPAAMGGLGITNLIHLMLVFISRHKTYAAPEPMDHYLEKLLQTDARLRAILGDALDGVRPTMLTGCRGVFRARCNEDTVGEGVVSVGDAWVDDGELGNVPALANGVHAGRVIAGAARRGDFSKAALNRANEFLDPRLLKLLAENKRMKLLSATLSEEELRQMFLFMQHMNYPIMMFGDRRQQAMMFARFFVKNAVRFLRYPRIARLMF